MKMVRGLTGQIKTKQERKKKDERDVPSEDSNSVAGLVAARKDPKIAVTSINLE